MAGDTIFIVVLKSQEPRRFFVNRKLDPDIEKMTALGAVKQELMRVRQILRRHKKFRDHARCHWNDDWLYDTVLPEGCGGAGMMTLSLRVLNAGCRNYCRRNGVEVPARCPAYIERQKARPQLLNERRQKKGARKTRKK